MVSRNWARRGRRHRHGQAAAVLTSALLVGIGLMLGMMALPSSPSASQAAAAGAGLRSAVPAPGVTASLSTVVTSLEARIDAVVAEELVSLVNRTGSTAPGPNASAPTTSAPTPFPPNLPPPAMSYSDAGGGSASGGAGAMPAAGGGGTSSNAASAGSPDTTTAPIATQVAGEPTTTTTAPTPTMTTTTSTSTTTTSTTTTQAPAVIVPGGAGGFGPVLAGNSRTNCIYVGSSAWSTALAAAEQETGVSYDCLETFSDQDPSWSSWDDPWITAPDAGLSSWLQADPGQRTIIVTEDLIPTSEVDAADPLTWEEPCEQGQFDTYATTLAKNLVAAGMGSAVVRLGQEMNGPWEPDFMGTTAVERSAWAGCFAAEVAAMRVVAGAHFLFDWDVAACDEDVPPAEYYPGNTYVDIIGVDFYDQTCTSSPLPAPSPSAATLVVDEPLGLETIGSFAEQNGKPLSIPEWGTKSAAENGNGDDPYYVTAVAQYIEQDGDFAFQSWFDTGTKGVLQLTSANPETLYAYQQAFG